MKVDDKEVFGKGTSSLVESYFNNPFIILTAAKSSSLHEIIQ